MLLISSLIIGICALAPALFVIIVLNKYLTSGVTGTLVSLTFGAILLLLFEFIFRQNRATIIQEFNEKIFIPVLKSFSEKFRQAGQLTAEQYKKFDGAGTLIKNAIKSSMTGWILDFPFVLMFLVALIYINWTAALITAIFMIIMYILTTQRVNFNLQQDSTANLEIFLTGLLTITIIAVGSTQIIAGTLDIGLLIGSNILAARALQGTNKFAKAKEFIEQRERAVKEIVDYVKSK
jgi:ABC-type bacteriocin/lantibiotic exporter with double-glycine peptidase domain|tara:strand:- start:9362 stop:10069 length:708 start_codon:yes stop_codon:yes gene_type:complete